MGGPTICRASTDNLGPPPTAAPEAPAGSLSLAFAIVLTPLLLSVLGFSAELLDSERAPLDWLRFPR